MHFGAPALKEGFEKRIPSRLLGSPGVTGVDATVAAWDDGQPWLDEILAQLRGTAIGWRRRSPPSFQA